MAYCYEQYILWLFLLRVYVKGHIFGISLDALLVNGSSAHEGYTVEFTASVYD